MNETPTWYQVETYEGLLDFRDDVVMSVEEVANHRIKAIERCIATPLTNQVYLLYSEKLRRYPGGFILLEFDRYTRVIGVKREITYLKLDDLHPYPYDSMKELVRSKIALPQTLAFAAMTREAHCTLMEFPELSPIYLANYRIGIRHESLAQISS